MVADKQVKARSFEQTYPDITRWVEEYGWVEIGQDTYSLSFVRAIDQGGVIWEGFSYQTMDEALRALNTGISLWLEENYGGE